MITVHQIDRLVISDDAIAARIWPRLGPRVRTAYTADRDAWVVLRRRVEAGETLSQSTLAAQNRVFLGWARALRAASGGPKHGSAPRMANRAAAPSRAASATAVTAPALPRVAPPLAATTAASLSIPNAPKASTGAGAAVAGGLVLASLVAVAARRKRA